MVADISFNVGNRTFVASRLSAIEILSGLREVGDCRAGAADGVELALITKKKLVILVEGSNASGEIVDDGPEQLGVDVQFAAQPQKLRDIALNREIPFEAVTADERNDQGVNPVCTAFLATVHHLRAPRPSSLQRAIGISPKGRRVMQ